MTVKEMKEILNSYPDDNALIEFCLYEDFTSSEIIFDLTCIEENDDMFLLNLGISESNCKDDVVKACSSILYNLYEKKPYKPLISKVPVVKFYKEENTSQVEA